MAGKKDAGNVVGAEALAAKLGYTARHIQRLVQEGMPKIGYGKYDTEACLLWYIGRLRQELQAEREKAGNLEYEQTRETKAKADIAELKAAQMRRELIPIEIYRQRVAAHHSVVRQNILALAGQVAPLLEGLTRSEIKARLHQRHKDLLNSLATGKEIIDAANGYGAGAPAEYGSDDPRVAGRTKQQSRSGTRPRTRSTTRHYDKRVGGSKPRTAQRNK